MKKSISIPFLFLIAVTFSSCDKFAELLMGGETQPQPLQINMPRDDNNFKVDDKTYTVLLFPNNRTFIYQGNTLKQDVRLTWSSANVSVRDVLQSGKSKFGKEFKVVIKPAEGVDYKSLVDILDEMSINRIDKYSLQDISTFEKAMQASAQ